MKFLTLLLLGIYFVFRFIHDYVVKVFKFFFSAITDENLWFVLFVVFLCLWIVGMTSLYLIIENKEDFKELLKVFNE